MFKKDIHLKYFVFLLVTVLYIARYYHNYKLSARCYTLEDISYRYTYLLRPFYLPRYKERLRPPPIKKKKSDELVIFRQNEISLHELRSEEIYFWLNEDTELEVPFDIPANNDIAEIKFFIRDHEKEKEFLIEHSWRFFQGWATAKGYSLHQLLYEQRYDFEFLCKAGYTTNDFKSAGYVFEECKYE